jgi:hypothetical protein
LVTLPCACAIAFSAGIAASIRTGLANPAIGTSPGERDMGQEFQARADS